MQKYTDLVLSNGRPVAGATVAVTTFPGGATPVIFADNGVTIIAGSVVTTDTNGRFSFYAADGRYTLTVAGPSISTQVIDDILLEDPADGSAVTVLGGSVNNSPVGNVTPSTGSFTTIITTGAVGIGAPSIPQAGLYVAKTITGSTVAFNVRSAGVVQQDVTAIAVGFSTALATTAAPFTLNSLQHFRADSAGTGAGSTLNDQIGFLVAGTLTNATNNYGFYGAIPAGTGRYNLYMSGTADNYIAGSLGIGGTPIPQASLWLPKPITGAISAYQVRAAGAVQSDVTSNGLGFSSAISTAATSFTLANLTHFRADQGTIGAGSTVTNQYGMFVASNLTGATNNYGIYSQIAAATNAYNFYAAGTAPNRFVGETLVIGATGGLGYGTGAGGAVTQLTSKATAVTLNKPCGQITMFNDSLAAGAEAFFTVNNSLVAASDVVVVTANWNPGAAYSARVYYTAAGSFNVAVKNNTAGALLDAVLLNFTVIKGATA